MKFNLIFLVLFFLCACQMKVEKKDVLLLGVDCNRNLANVGKLKLNLERHGLIFQEEMKVDVFDSAHNQREKHSIAGGSLFCEPFNFNEPRDQSKLKKYKAIVFDNSVIKFIKNKKDYLQNLMKNHLVSGGLFFVIDLLKKQEYLGDEYDLSSFNLDGRDKVRVYLKDGPTQVEKLVPLPNHGETGEDYLNNFRKALGLKYSKRPFVAYLVKKLTKENCLHKLSGLKGGETFFIAPTLGFTYLVEDFDPDLKTYISEKNANQFPYPIKCSGCPDGVPLGNRYFLYKKP